MTVLRIEGATRRSVVAAATAIMLLLMGVWLAGEARGGGDTFYFCICSMDDRLLVKESVRVNQRVTMVYIHSVERVPVLEVYEVRGEGPLYLSELISRDPLLSYPGYERYRVRPWDGQSEGPLPTDLDRSTRDWFAVKGLEQAKVMPQAVGSEAVNHRILVGRNVIALGDLAAPGEVVKLIIKGERSLPDPCR
jgi:hypothetical protein